MRLGWDWDWKPQSPRGHGHGRPRQGRPSRGKAQQASQPSQGRALQARWQSQARQHSLQEQQLRRRSRRTAAEGGCVVVLAERVAWLGSATSPGVLCLALASSKSGKGLDFLGFVELFVQRKNVKNVKH